RTERVRFLTSRDALGRAWPALQEGDEGGLVIDPAFIVHADDVDSAILTRFENHVKRQLFVLENSDLKAQVDGSVRIGSLRSAHGRGVHSFRHGVRVQLNDHVLLEKLPYLGLWEDAPLVDLAVYARLAREVDEDAFFLASA